MFVDFFPLKHIHFALQSKANLASAHFHGATLLDSEQLLVRKHKAASLHILQKIQCVKIFNNSFIVQLIYNKFLINNTSQAEIKEISGNDFSSDIHKLVKVESLKRMSKGSWRNKKVCTSNYGN